MSDIAIHQERLDRMYDLLPCWVGKPSLVFDQAAGFPGEQGGYYYASNTINLNLKGFLGCRMDVFFTEDDYWLLALAHEYAHAYAPATRKEMFAYKEEGPHYLRHEKDMDKLAAVIVLALAGEPGFPDRKQAKKILQIWHTRRSQYFFEVSRRWTRKMQKEYCPTFLAELENRFNGKKPINKPTKPKTKKRK